MILDNPLAKNNEAVRGSCDFCKVVPSLLKREKFLLRPMDL